MKFSDAMLKGYEQVGGKQCRGALNRVRGGRIVAHCPLGAAVRGGMKMKNVDVANFAVAAAWGDSVVILNDVRQMPWEHIYGMAVAAGL